MTEVQAGPTEDEVDEATFAFARLAHGLQLDDLPDATTAAAINVLLDTLGSAIAGTHAAGIRDLVSLMSDLSPGRSHVWFTGEGLAPPAATLVNSSMTHALEFDDLHSELPMHSGVVVVSAALAVADVRPGLSAKDLLPAIVAGTEILCRMARATKSYKGTGGFRGWNPTAVVAGFAAAAVAGRLLGLDEEGIARAMGLSYAQAGGNQQCIADGGIVKRMQPGLTAEAGVRAAWMARAGITGAIHAIEGKNGFFAVYEAGDYDPEALKRDLGQTFEIEKVRFKRYPICGMAQPGVDCLRELIAENGLSPEAIASVDVHGSRFVADMVGRPYRPGATPEVDAQFNLAYCLATVLETGDFKLADLEKARTLSPSRQALADTIPVTYDETLTGKWETRVTVELASGERLTKQRKKAAWQDDRPMTRTEILEKFADAAAAASHRVSPDVAEAVSASVLSVIETDTLSPLLGALSGRIGSARDLEREGTSG